MSFYRIVFILAGAVLIALAGKAAPALDKGLERLFSRLPEQDVSTEDEDILNNKTKWRIILAGYIIFGVVALFSIISVYTLNKKINTLYKSIQNMEEIVYSTEGSPSGK